MAGSSYGEAYGGNGGGPTSDKGVIAPIGSGRITRASEGEKVAKEGLQAGERRE